MDEKFLTVRQFAERAHLGQERIRQLIRTRQIRAVRLKQWLIPEHELHRFIQSRWNYSPKDNGGAIWNGEHA